MIFLFDECDDEKCSMNNEYLNSAFKVDMDITDKCVKQQSEIDDYQDECKKEALEMFVKYFDSLWN